MSQVVTLTKLESLWISAVVPMQLCVTEQNPINLLTQPIQLIKAIKQLVQFMQLIQKRKLQLSQLNHVTQQNSHK